MAKSKKGPGVKSIKRKINAFVKECSKDEMLSDIEYALNLADWGAEALSNSAHFDTKRQIDSLRKKYGIKTKTYVNCATIFGGRMTIDKYNKLGGERWQR